MSTERAVPSRARRARGFLLGVLVLPVLVTGCRQDMQDQPRYDADQASAFFADGRGNRPRVAGTVVHGSFRENRAYYEGKEDGQPVAVPPVEVSAEVLGRGRERYDIYCSPCHDRTGAGNGMIVQRGLRRPSSFHIQRLREAPAGYFFDVITNGFGIMLSYRAQVPVDDRWAIISYIRALQLSQNATIGDVPEAQRAALGHGAAGH